jgi:nucleotide-binding universal stress UspA family protein
MSRLPSRQPAILCGIDEGSESHTAARVAAQFAQRLGATLVLVHVALEPYVLLGPSVTFEERRRDALAYHEAGLVRTVLDPVAVSGPSVERRVVFGASPSEELRRLAEDEAVELIVVASRRHGALASMLGNTSADLARSAPCPVVVVPAGVPDTVRCAGAIVCAVADEPEDTNVVRTAAELAQRVGTVLVLVHAGEPGDASILDPWRDLAQETAPDLVVEQHVAAGGPAEALASYAADRDASLIAVGTRGRGALVSAVLGSVSAELVRIADRPMLVVPSRD